MPDAPLLHARSLTEPLQLIKCCTFNCHQLITDYTDRSSDSWFHTTQCVLSLAILPQLKGGFCARSFFWERLNEVSSASRDISDYVQMVEGKNKPTNQKNHTHEKAMSHEG